MNKQERGRLRGIRDELLYLAESELSKFDNLPDSLRESRRGERFEETVAALEEASGSIEDALRVWEE